MAEKNGVQWYNDSKATNVGAALAAIAGQSAEKIILIAGGQGKGQDFEPLRDVTGSRCRHVILLGEDADKIQTVIDKRIPVSHVVSMQEAVVLARKYAESGDVVLLSPACASFDMFNGYAHRGDVFKQCVLEVLA